MPTLTAYMQSAGGYIASTSTNETYAQARSGGGLVQPHDTQTTGNLGQGIIAGEYLVAECFLSFDTSSLGANAIVQSATLSLAPATPAPNNGYVYRVCSYDWGATLTAGDFVPGASMAGLTQRASFTATGLVVGTRFDCADAAMIAGLSLTGTTRLIVFGERDMNNTAPIDDQHMNLNLSEAGTSLAPRLTVVYLTPGQGAVMSSD